jgi:hypothetical protein
MVVRSPADDIEEFRKNSRKRSIEMLAMISVIDKHIDELEEMNPETTFRIKHISMDKGAVYELKNAGVLRDSGREMGRPTDWEFSTPGKDILDLVKRDRVERFTLPKDGVELFERHLDLFEKLPNSSRESFEASEYDMNSSLLRALREAGLFEREEKNVGTPDVWSLTETASSVQTLVFV